MNVQKVISQVDRSLFWTDKLLGKNFKDYKVKTTEHWRIEH